MQTVPKTANGVDIPPAVGLTITASCWLTGPARIYRDVSEPGGPALSLAEITVDLGVPVHVYIVYPTERLSKLRMRNECRVGLRGNKRGGITIGSVTLPDDRTHYPTYDVVN